MASRSLPGRRSSRTNAGGIYTALTDFFLADERLRFRGLVVPDKDLLDHARFDQWHDDWYYNAFLHTLD